MPYFGEAMKPTVRFECETCGWTHHVPDARIAMVEGKPRSTYVPWHTCDGGASLLERGQFDVELFTGKPGFNMRIKL